MKFSYYRYSVSKSVTFTLCINFFFFIILKHDSVFCLNIHLYNVNDSLFDFTLWYQDQIPSLNSQCKTFFFQFSIYAMFMSLIF